MNVRLKNVGDGNLRLARQVDVNLDVRPRIKHCGDAFVIITEQIGKFRDRGLARSAEFGRANRWRARQGFDFLVWTVSAIGIPKDATHSAWPCRSSWLPSNLLLHQC